MTLARELAARGGGHGARRRESVQLECWTVHPVGRCTRRMRATVRRARCWEIGTQTVFGAGPADATLMFIGEAPGQQEDRSGVPFVGPAGQLFDGCLRRLGIDRARVYVTNTVKHRPWVQSDSGRQEESRAEAERDQGLRALARQEMEIVQPAIDLLPRGGRREAHAGKDFKLTVQRGQWFTTGIGSERVRDRPSVVHADSAPGSTRALDGDAWATCARSAAAACEGIGNR